ncbi:hypothetical protein DFH29DRAFT_491367 [Suillus ampliporus]|nr:hypothetical protein DFH29DRAFT_491367 [Suillus ampliporus]
MCARMKFRRSHLPSESVTLSILPSIYLTGTHGTSSSPLGPKHTIELPRTEGMSSLAEHFSSSPTTERPYSQQPFTTEVARGKRIRSDSINQQSPLSPSFGSDSNKSELSANSLLKRIRTEQHFSLQDSVAEEKRTLNSFSTGHDATSQLGNEFPQPSSPISLVPLSITTPQQPLHASPSPLSTYHNAFPRSPGISNSHVPTGPRPPGDREAIKRLSLELSKVRGQLATLKHCEKGISEELARLGFPQPKSEETAPSLNDLEAQLMLVEVELQQERIQRLRAERMLSEVERECRVPFVVPALFQAFRRISELGRNE